MIDLGVMAMKSYGITRLRDQKSEEIGLWGLPSRRVCLDLDAALAARENDLRDGLFLRALRFVNFPLAVRVRWGAQSAVAPAIAALVLAKKNATPAWLKFIGVLRARRDLRDLTVCADRPLPPSLPAKIARLFPRRVNSFYAAGRRVLITVSAIAMTLVSCAMVVAVRLPSRRRRFC
jgi:hypothetical protein